MLLLVQSCISPSLPCLMLSHGKRHARKWSWGLRCQVELRPGVMGVSQSTGMPESGDAAPCYLTFSHSSSLGNSCMLRVEVRHKLRLFFDTIWTWLAASASSLVAEVPRRGSHCQGMASTLP